MPRKSGLPDLLTVKVQARLSPISIAVQVFRHRLSQENEAMREQDDIFREKTDGLIPDSQVFGQKNSIKPCPVGIQTRRPFNGILWSLEWLSLAAMMESYRCGIASTLIQVQLRAKVRVLDRVKSIISLQLPISNIMRKKSKIFAIINSINQSLRHAMMREKQLGGISEETEFPSTRKSYMMDQFTPSNFLDWTNIISQQEVLITS